MFGNISKYLMKSNFYAKLGITQRFHNPGCITKSTFLLCKVL